MEYYVFYVPVGLNFEPCHITCNWNNFFFYFLSFCFRSLHAGSMVPDQACFVLFLAHDHGLDPSFSRWRWCYKSRGSFPGFLASEVQKLSIAPIPGQTLATKVSKSGAISQYVPGVNPPGWPLISALSAWHIFTYPSLLMLTRSHHSSSTLFTEFAKQYLSYLWPCFWNSPKKSLFIFYSTCWEILFQN